MATRWAGPTPAGPQHRRHRILQRSQRPRRDGDGLRSALRDGPPEAPRAAGSRSQRVGSRRRREPERRDVAEAPRRKLYAARKHIVEPVFGQIKGVRGFRKFLLRGLELVSAEWQLICLTHNLLKIWRFTFSLR
ncbi:MAG: transposase [Planctomycetales bacterium]|nr:transposase [Planctomycetales bacterium]